MTRRLTLCLVALLVACESTPDADLVPRWLIAERCGPDSRSVSAALAYSTKPPWHGRRVHVVVLDQ